MKPCTSCDSWLPLFAYYRDARNADGHSGSCKECQRAAARESSRRRYVVKGTMRQRRDECGRFAS